MAGLLPFVYASRNLSRSPARLLLSVGGAALVVALVMAGAGFALGMDAALRSSGTPGNVILIGSGSEESIERSEVSPATAGVVAASVDGIRTVAGQPLVSSEVHVALPVQVAGAAAAASERDEDQRTSRDLAMVRGVTPAAFLVHPQVRMVAGRAPLAGANEVMLGTTAAKRLGLDPAQLQRSLKDDGTGGPELAVDNRTLRVTGLFTAPATVMDGEVWAPLTDLLVLTQRDTISTVIIGLEPTAHAADVEAFAQRRIDLELTAMPETAYYAGQSAFYRPVRIMVLASAALVAAGALLGGLNTMYAAFASRVREIGMLQCLGYSRTAVVVSLLQESVLASMAGALIGVAVAALALDGLSIDFSMGTFGIAVDHRVVVLGLLAGLLVGVAGCVVPALRCLRLPLPVSLKTD
ncbi:MAG: FtsX-like permease family protein [Phycisphaerales bacterium]